jgi:hypothetical protein
MNIPFQVGDETHYLRSDSQGYNLSRREDAKVTKKNPKGVRYSPYAYFSRIDFAITSMMEMKVRGSTADTLGQLLADVRRAHDEVRDLWGLAPPAGAARSPTPHMEESE